MLTISISEPWKVRPEQQSETLEALIVMVREANPSCQGDLTHH